MQKQLIRLLIPIVILVVAGGALWFVLSQPLPTLPPENEGDPLHKETFTEEGRYYEIEASYPLITSLRETAGISADTQAVNLMTRFIDTEVTRFKDESGVMTMTPAEAEQWGLGGDRIYALGVEYREYGSPSTVSYLFDVYLDTGGAHPNAYHRSFTFDRESGAALSVGDLFEPGADYLAVLSERSRAELPGAIAAKGGTSIDEVNIEFIEDGTTPIETSFQTFYLTGDALVLVFSPYQVGPWVIGTQELSIPRSTLTGLKTLYR